MFGLFIGYLVAKGIVIGISAYFCELNAAVLACVIVGAIIEGIIALLLEDYDYTVAKEVVYFASILLQIVPMFIVTIQMFSLPEKNLNFMMAIILGWFGVMTVIDWFSNAFDGPVFFAYYYGAAIGFFAVEGILFAIIESYHTLLIVNMVIFCIAIIAVIIARLKLGSNVE